MRKLLVCAVLIAALATASLPTNPTVLGQAAKVDPKTSGKPGVIEIAAGKDKKFRFTIRKADGKLLATSGPNGFATEKEAEDAVEALKDVLKNAKVTKKSAKDVK